MLSLSLACLLLFSSVGLGKAQETASPSPIQPSNTNFERTSTTPFSQQTGNETPTIRKIPSVKSINPKNFYISIPQSWLIQEDVSRYKDEKVDVIVVGENFPQQDNSLTNKIDIKIGKTPNIVTTTATEVTEDGKAIFASFSNKQLKQLSRGTHPVNIEVGGKATNIDRQVIDDELQVKVIRPVSGLTTLIVLGLATICVVVLVLIIYLLAMQAKKANLPNTFLQKNRNNLNTFQWLILDRKTNTLSLAHAQFVWWLTIIVFGYLFLFIGRGAIQGVWEFVPLSGFGYTFLISLATLVTAQATSEIRGSKGAGEVHPAWSDLVVHGGVLALERVQQVVWNIIIGIAFIVILLVTYTTASSLPTIPTELLALMGISAGGYIGGKAVRKAGANINQVVLYAPSNESPDYITIAGANFSLGGKILNSEGQEVINTQIRDAGVIIQLVYLDSKTREEIPNTLVEVKKDDIITMKTDPDAPMEFCRRLKIPLKNLRGLPTEDWLAKFTAHFDSREVKITIINADGQRAVWDGSIIAPERETPPPAVESNSATELQTSESFN